MQIETKFDALLMSPPLSVAVAHWLGVYLPLLGYAATIIYTALAGFYMVRREWRASRDRKAAESKIGGTD